MSTIKVQTTYDIVTHESAEQGDFADHGFYGPGGWTYSIADDDFQALVAKVGRQQALADMTPEPEEFDTIDDAVDFIANYGPFESSCSPVCGNGHCWVTQSQSSDDIGEPRLSFHVDTDNDWTQAAIIKALCE